MYSAVGANAREYPDIVWIRPRFARVSELDGRSKPAARRRGYRKLVFEEAIRIDETPPRGVSQWNGKAAGSHPVGPDLSGRAAPVFRQSHQVGHTFHQSEPAGGRLQAGS